MKGRKPFTPEDYRIGHEGVRGTSDYPTKGTPPKDVLLSPHTGRRRMAVRGSGSAEVPSSAPNPEEALIAAQEAGKLGKGLYERGTVDVDSEVNGEVVEGEEQQDDDEITGGVVSGGEGIGMRRDRVLQNYALYRRENRAEESHGSQKPRGKKPEHK